MIESGKTAVLWTLGREFFEISTARTHTVSAGGIFLFQITFYPISIPAEVKKMRDFFKISDKT